MQRNDCQSRLPLRIVMLATATLLVLTGCGGDAEGVGSVARETIAPTPSFDTALDDAYWADSECSTSADITSVVTRFVDAFNDGDVESLDTLFSDESANLQLSTVPSMTTNLDQFQAYSVIGAGHMDFIAHSKDETLSYLTDRHEQRERLQLTIVDVFPYSSGGGVLFQSTRVADDLPEREVFGRIWVNCEQEWIVALAMGDAPS